MKKSLKDLKLALEESCTFLRSFTLGRPGFTQRDGLAGIERVSRQCDRLSALFSSGPDAKEAATLVARGRSCIIAAESRLALLRDR
jgi:hypothetical protein